MSKQKKKKEATEALNLQLSKLRNHEEDFQYNVWVNETKEIIKKYMGETSNFYLSSDRFYHSNDPRESRAYITACIEFVEKYGAHEEKKPHPLTTLKTGWYGLFFGTYLVMAFGIGVWVQSQKEAYRKIESLESEIQILKDSIVTLTNHPEEVPQNKAH